MYIIYDLNEGVIYSNLTQYQKDQLWTILRERYETAKAERIGFSVKKVRIKKIS